jgi:GntR family transcriptional regulator, carbon starvation induced regulator
VSGYSASAARETRSGALHAEDGGTLAQAAFRALRSDIIRGVRPPAERLRIEKLKTIYDIGPTPLREALQMLVAEELVLTEGNRGFTVAPLDFDEFADLNVARTAIELAALRLSLQNGDNEWEAGVVAAGYLMKKHDAALTLGKAGVPEEWERANAAFHTAIVAACGSKWLLKSRAGLYDQCARYRLASVYQRIGRRDLSAEHAAIAEAALARDVELACALTEEHFERTASALPNAQPTRVRHC